MSLSLCCAASRAALAAALAVVASTACSSKAVGDGTGPVEAADVPAGAKRVFVTSSAYAGSFGTELASAKAPSGAAAGDALCQVAADAAQLGGTWTAYLNDQTTLSNDRITGAGPWYGTDGKLVFTNKANLLTSPVNALRYDERGFAAPAYVRAWVGSAQETCANWTKSDAALFAVTGIVGSSAQSWRAGSRAQCHDRLHLYCFEE